MDPECAEPIDSSAIVCLQFTVIETRLSTLEHILQLSRSCALHDPQFDTFPAS